MLAPTNDLVGLRSRRHIMPFALAQPRTVAEAHQAMQDGGRAVLMAGGVDLIDWLKHGESVDRVIALKDVDALKEIRREGDRLVIGAMASHADVASSGVVAASLPDLGAIWQSIANPRVRYAGTIGGNVMSGRPHYDAAPALLALGASARVSEAGRSDVVAIEDLPTRSGLLLEAVTIDTTPRVLLLAERSLHPTLSLCLAVRLNEGGDVATARLAIGCAFPRPRAIDLQAPAGTVSSLIDAAPQIVRAAVAGLPAPIDDGLASAAYRSRMIGVMARRLLARLGARA
jgi:aerobic carbon-monoxide dehydrogenase medium subunit